MNTYDWLGHGLYFWEDNHMRAQLWAEEKHSDPFVLGAYIDLGNCLNLVDEACLMMLKEAHGGLQKTLAMINQPMPQNTGQTKGAAPPMRRLDCAVVNFVHQSHSEAKTPEDKAYLPFDTVRAAFIEGKELYSGSGFSDQSHLQICVRNPKSILGFFLPLPEERYPTWVF